MKVCLITETFLPQVNGIVRTLEKIVKHLEANGHETLIIALGDGEDQYSKTPIVRVPGVKFCLYEELHLVAPQDDWVKKFVDKFDLAQIPAAIVQSLLPMPHPIVEKTFEEFKPDVVHLVTPATLGAVGFYYVDQHEIPCISSYHTDLTSYASQYQMPYLETLIDATNKLIYNRTDRVLAPSKSSKKQLKRAGVRNVGIFGRGVDTNLFNPKHKSKRSEVLTKHGLDPEKKTIMFSGRLAEEKSIPILIEAFKAFYKDYDLQLMIVGDGPLKKTLSKQLKKTPHVFTGMHKGEDYAELFGAADIFAFPSKTETFGQVVLEAMASGLPVLGFDAPGVRDLVVDQVSGLLAPEHDNDGFKASLKKLLDNPQEAQSYGEAGREEATKRSWTNILDELIAEYESVITKRVVS